MANRAVAVDAGSHTVKVLAARMGKHGPVVTRFAGVSRATAEEELSQLGIPLDGVVAGIAGKDMILRYNQVPPSPDWQLKNLMELEIQDMASQSGGSLSADYNLLPVTDEESGMETVLMALARDEALERCVQLVAAGGGTVAAHVPNCIAIYNAYLRCGDVEPDAVVCVANLGRETTDIALVRGGDLLFARNLTGGGKVLDDAIAAAFDVSERKAEKLKSELLDLDPASRGRFASGQAEKVTMAAGGAASMIVAAIQSSVAFCQSQTKIKDLRLDKVLLCGGTARARGIEGMLREALRCPVEKFDPFAACDLAELPPAEADQLREMRSEAVVALGLAVGRLDGALYSLEILPEAVKRRQRFWQRTIFNVAAAAVAVALLAYLAWDGSRRSAAASRELGSVRQRVSSANNVHKEAVALKEQNEARRVLIDALAERSVPLDGSLRALRALGDLPPELWLDKLEVVTRSGAAAGGKGEQRQFIVVAGRGKEVSGVDVGEVYRAFSAKFRDHPLIPEVTAKTEPGEDGATKFEITIDVRPPAQPEAEREAAKD
jgi:type IV pilus assembly protein PilM